MLQSEFELLYNNNAALSFVSSSPGDLINLKKLRGLYTSFQSVVVVDDNGRVYMIHGRGDVLCIARAGFPCVLDFDWEDYPPNYPT